MTITNAPRIVTNRLHQHEDSHTLQRYLSTGGYEALRKAFTQGREWVQDEVNKANLLGRGGAGFPAGRKWSMMRKAEPVYLVVYGDETGLLESLEGKRGFPRIKPPYFPAAIGLYGAPTIVNNVETMSNIPWIVTNGGDAFSALGEGTSTGTRIFAVSGHVKRPGNFEVEFGKTTFRDLIYAPVYAGGIRNDHQLKAVIPGGASSYWIGPDQIDAPLNQDDVQRNLGTMLGSGSIVAMDETACMVRAAWRITKFFHRESCGQCTPCREG